jgi:hypothetical protein
MHQAIDALDFATAAAAAKRMIETMEARLDG